MSSTTDKFSKKGVRTSYISTVIGISLVLFMIGLVIGGVLGLDNVQRKAKESLQGDLFFKSELNESDIKQIEQELKTWDEFTEVYFVSPERAKEEFAGTGQKERIHCRPPLDSNRKKNTQPVRVWRPSNRSFLPTIPNRSTRSITMKAAWSP
jgi:hypothetical protein